jgi:hypothetical protein
VSWQIGWDETASRDQQDKALDYQRVTFCFLASRDFFFARATASTKPGLRSICGPDHSYPRPELLCPHNGPAALIGSVAYGCIFSAAMGYRRYG